MNTSIETLRQDEQGFTLVELAVVMIIIGLLIGGILKGQELITNARVTTTISQLESTGAAYNGFVDQYNVQPGDMVTANNRLPNCANQCIGPAATAGNGIINVAIGAAPALANEGAAFFAQLLSAGYITGMDGTNALGFSTSNPTTPLGGGLFIGDGRAGANVGGFPAVRQRPHVVINGVITAAAAGSGVLLPSQAGTLDRRLDDGNPQTGSVVGQNTAGECVGTAGDAFYDESVGTSVCAVAYRL